MLTMASSRQRLNPTKGSSAGVTLTELLVAAAISGLTVVAAVQILGPQLRVNQRMEGYTRLQERWARVAYLLDSEVQRARSITAGTNSITLIVPISTDTGGDLVTIIYKLDTTGTKLLRDGPVIDEWGKLSPTTSLNDQLVLDGVKLNGFVTSVDNSSLRYSVDMTDPNSDATYNAKGSAARGRSDCSSLEADANAAAIPCN